MALGLHFEDDQAGDNQSENSSLSPFLLISPPYIPPSPPNLSSSTTFNPTIRNNYGYLGPKFFESSISTSPNSFNHLSPQSDNIIDTPSPNTLCEESLLNTQMRNHFQALQARFFQPHKTTRSL